MRKTSIAWPFIISLCIAAICGMVLAPRAFGADPSPSPQEMLERIAQDPLRASSRADVEALARMSDGLEDGALRNTLDLFVGEAYRGRLGSPSLARKHFERVAASSSADALTRRMAAGALVDVLIATGENAAALEHARATNDRDLVARARAAVNRARLHHASAAVLALFVALAGWSIARAAKARRLGASWPTLRAFAVRATFFATWLGGAGAILARAYDAADPAPFLRLAFVIVPLLVLARAWALAGSRSMPARALRATLAVNAAMASAFLVLESVDPRLLGSFGL